MDTSLVVQWLRLCTSNARSMGLVSGQGTKIQILHSAAKKREREIEDHCTRTPHRDTLERQQGGKNLPNNLTRQ